VPAKQHAVGDVIVIRTVTAGRIRWAGPSILVGETPKDVVYYRPPGTMTKITGGARDNPSRRDRELALRSELLQGEWKLFDHRAAGDGVLTAHRFGDWFSVLLRPGTRGGDFVPSAVNIETPHLRTAVGFDIDDLCLDIVIDEDLNHTLKDADDLAERMEFGVYTREQYNAIHVAANAAIARIDSREPPFDGAWAGWCPDPAWPVPSLVSGWDVVEAA
jgi:hypothetical protein